MKRIFIVVFILCCFIIPFGTFSFADDAPVSIYGGINAIPIEERNIEMESETIKIDFRSKTHEIIFNFVNTGNEENMDIGFPIKLNNPFEDLGYSSFEAFDYPSMKQYAVSEKNSKHTVINGMNLDYNGFYTWKVHFGKGEKKSILVRYNTENPGYYILRTGSLWKGEIKRIDVYVTLDKKRALPEIYAEPHNFTYKGSSLEWHFVNIDPKFDLIVNNHMFIPKYFNIKKEYYYPATFPDKGDYIYDRNFYYIDISQPLGSNDEESIKTYYSKLSSDDKKDYVKSELRYRINNWFEKSEEVKNEIYARHGYIFKSTKWINYFKNKEWYVKNSNFNTNDFTPVEMVNIDYILLFQKMFGKRLSDTELLNKAIEFEKKYNLG